MRVSAAARGPMPLARPRTARRSTRARARHLRRARAPPQRHVPAIGVRNLAQPVTRQHAALALDSAARLALAGERVGTHGRVLISGERASTARCIAWPSPKTAWTPKPPAYLARAPSRGQH